MLRITTEKTIPLMSGDNAPVCRVEPGEVFAVETLDCFSGRLTHPEQKLEDLPWDSINPATGPIFINGAEAGDVLRIEILDIKIGPRGVVLCESADMTRLGRSGKAHSLFVPAEGNKVRFPDGTVVPVTPMIGVLGTAPAGDPVPTTVPGPHGGNMDNRHIAAGSTVFLPVFHKGALLAAGDLHASMSDGEAVGSGIEIPGEIVMKAEVIKNCPIDHPMVKTAQSIETVASAPTLDEAADLAVKTAFRYLTVSLGLEADRAWLLIASFCHVSICQFVNKLKTVRCEIPLELIGDVGSFK